MDLGEAFWLPRVARHHEVLERVYHPAWYQHSETQYQPRASCSIPAGTTTQYCASRSTRCCGSTAHGRAAYAARVSGIAHGVARTRCTAHAGGRTRVLEAHLDHSTE
eukprot:3760013-Rhodomonas_salina.2